MLPAHAGAAGRTSRRQSPRLEVEALIDGRLARGDLRLKLHDLGFGGFAVEAPIAFAIGSVHRFRFVVGDTMVVMLRAEAVYTRQAGARDGMDHVLTGFKYVLDGDDAERAVDVLLEAALSPIAFD